VRKHVLKAVNVAMIGVCAAVYAVVGRLTDLGVTVGGVAFWPAAVIPAVFAVLFGPLVGGVGAGIGIFIRDMLFHGDPLLSLSVGVTANVVAFATLGYVARRGVDPWKLKFAGVLGTVVVAFGFLLPTVLLPEETTAYTRLSTMQALALFALTVVISLLILGLVARLKRGWRGFVAGSVIGLAVGSAMIAFGVWAYSQLFFSPSGYFKTPLPLALMPVVFVWTFATEAPFVLVLGPPVIKACYRAFPSLATGNEQRSTV
jgi:uncharacterized membrane protein